MSKNSFFQSQIRTPIGNREYSDPLDVINTRKNLKRINQYDGETDLGFFDKNLDESIRKFQSKEGLKIDGLMNPSGETERALNRNLRGEKNLISSLRLRSPVGTRLTNDSGDVKQVQRSLGRLGFIPPSRGFEANGIIDPVTSKGIIDF